MQGHTDRVSLHLAWSVGPGQMMSTSWCRVLSRGRDTMLERFGCNLCHGNTASTWNRRCRRVHQGHGMLNALSQVGRTLLLRYTCRVL